VKKLVAMGFQDLENQVPMATDTIFRIFSMTKPIAGTALMMLYDQGRFELSDPVEKYIPEFVGLQVAKEDGPEGMPITEPAGHKMTMRELMSHSGGLTYGFFSKSQVDSLYAKAKVLDPESTLQQMVEKLGRIPLWAQPGSTWHYSVSVDVQGYLVEILSGMPFDRFLAEKIFQPLGMHDPAFYVPPEKAPRLSRYYASKDGKLISAPNAKYLEKPTFLSGGGGLVSTAQDYMRFAQMHVSGGELDGIRILSTEAVELMRSNQLPENIKGLGGFMDPGNTFGLDFAVVNDSEQAYGQSEGVHWWFGIAGTWFWIDPANDFVFVAMIQTRNVRDAIGLHRQSKTLIYQ
jgi:CubicO group peptidase (beta-lactamase class C family)